MGKGEEKRKLILRRAFEESTRVGLEGLTIGTLATALKMSKSGLHAHFGNKEELQLQVIDYATEQFMCKVIHPAMHKPVGSERMRLLFENWLAWCCARLDNVAGFFVAATAEFDDRPGPVRDRLLASQSRWMQFIAATVREGVKAGMFRADVEPAQFAFDMYGVILAYHHAARMLGDAEADQRAHESFDRLLERVRAPEARRKSTH